MQQYPIWGWNVKDLDATKNGADSTVVWSSGDAHEENAIEESR